MQKLFNDKLGITFDGVKTGKYADLGDVTAAPYSRRKALSCKTALTGL
jgi:protease-4